MDDYQRRQQEMLAHPVRLRERQSDLEAVVMETRETNARLAARQIDLESFPKQVAENNIRLSRILEVHDYDSDELDARLRRLQERRRPDKRAERPPRRTDPS